MVTILLEQIIEILKGWLSSFTSWAEGVATNLGLIEEATEYIDDIYDDTTAIKDNTTSIVDSNTRIQGYSLIISNKTSNIDNNVTAIKNNVGSIATSSGTAAAFAEDIATNTLNTDNRLVTIGSDTTQLRTNSNTITTDVSDIKSMLNYFSYGLIVTEDVEGPLCSFDTDLIDYLQNLNITIDPDNNGVSSVTINRTGKNLWNGTLINGDVPLDLKPNTTYTFTANNLMPPQSAYLFVRRSTDGVNFDLVERIVNGTNEYARTITIEDGYIYSLWSNNNYSRIGNVQIIVGSTPEDYEAYKGNTYTISLGQTVTDGGELNALTGVLKVNTTPPTYSVVDTIAVKTFKGINNIWADTGNSMVTYKETLKHKIDKEA